MRGRDRGPGTREPQEEQAAGGSRLGSRLRLHLRGRPPPLLGLLRPELAEEASLAATLDIVPPTDGRSPEIPDAGARVGARGPRQGRSRGRVRRPRDGRGAAPGDASAAARAVGLGAAAHTREPADLPALRRADRARRQRLPVLRAAPARARRRIVSAIGSARAGPSGRLALLAAVAAIGLGAAALAGCGDDEETVATTTTTTTETGTTETTAPPEQTGGGGGTTDDPTPADTGPTVPESGGVGADDHQSEQDVEGNDVPPPPGSPAEQFEQECEAHPEIC